jgi:uncharacterized protein (DUF1499 family)
MRQHIVGCVSVPNCTLTHIENTTQKFVILRPVNWHIGTNFSGELAAEILRVVQVP